MKSLTTKIQLQRDTASKLNAAGIFPIGTPLYATDTEQLRIADGINTFNNLDLNATSLNGLTSTQIALKTELPTTATVSKTGLIKPDGTTITINSSGIISSSSSVIDDLSIKKNGLGAIQAVGVVDKYTGIVNGEWTGTLAQYNAATNNNTTFIRGVRYAITDDMGDITAATAANVTTSIKGIPIDDILDGSTAKKAIADDAGNIIKTTYSTNKIYSGAGEPSLGLGNNNDIYVKYEA